ncbi:hypothetical protein [Nonomuraea sp. NPDC002799]
MKQATLLIKKYGLQSIKLKGGMFAPDQEIAAIKADVAVLAPAVPGLGGVELDRTPWPS